MKITCIKCGVAKNLDEFHLNKSYTTGRSGKCRKCTKKSSHEYYLKNKDSINIKNKLWNINNKEKVAERKSHYYKENIEKISLYNSDWKNKNRHKTAAYRSKYRATLLKATPNWLTKDHLDKINLFYLRAKELSDKTGIKHHVDHIEPLLGDNFIGLHVPWNLQVLPHFENERKGNKLIN